MLASADAQWRQHQLVCDDYCCSVVYPGDNQRVGIFHDSWKAWTKHWHAA